MYEGAPRHLSIYLEQARHIIERPQSGENLSNIVPFYDEEIYVRQSGLRGPKDFMAFYLSILESDHTLSQVRQYVVRILFQAFKNYQHRFCGDLYHESQQRFILENFPLEVICAYSKSYCLNTKSPLPKLLYEQVKTQHTKKTKDQEDTMRNIEIDFGWKPGTVKLEVCIDAWIVDGFVDLKTLGLECEK